MVTKSFENRLWIQHHFHFCDILLQPIEGPRKTHLPSHIPFLVPLNFINFIADRHSSSSNRIHCNQRDFIRTKFVQKIVSQKFRSSIFTKIITKETFGSSKRIRFLVRISTRTRASPSLRYFFTFIPLFVFFFFFLFNSFVPLLCSR